MKTPKPKRKTIGVLPRRRLPDAKERRRIALAYWRGQAGKGPRLTYIDLGMQYDCSSQTIRLICHSPEHIGLSKKIAC